jgi:type I restriction enzyme, S subunit
MSYPRVRLHRVLLRRSDDVPVEATETYRTAGIYSYGRGLFERPVISGSETSYRSYFQLHEGQFVYSKLFAWEGAVAVVEPAFDGLFVSSEFPTFDIDPDVALTEYIAALCLWPEFHRAIAGGRSGLGVRRQRVNPERLLSVEVPLPDLSEQARIVGRLTTLLGEVDVIGQRLERNDSALIVALYPGLVTLRLKAETTRPQPVGELMEFVNDLVRPGEPTEPAEAFVGLQHIESHTGRRIGSLPLGGEKGRKFRFQPGDIVYGYLRPYLNKVWVADMHGLCSVDQYVLRPTNGVPASYLAHALRSRAILDKAIELTHSLQLPRLRSGLLSNLEIPVVASERVRAVTDELDHALETIVEARALRLRQETVIKGLKESVLNRAFAGLL